MERSEAIEQIVDILRKHEDDLSDGYGYYSGSRTDEVLRKIAEEVYTVARSVGED